MLKFLNKYYIIAVLFFAAAVVCIAVPLIITMNNFVAAALVISGMAYFIIGSCAIIFSDNESFDPKIIGLVPVQLCINLCRITANYGISGGACFLPKHITGEAQVMQLNPVSNQTERIILTKKTFTDGKIPGILTVPAGDPLLQDLRKRNAMVVPEGKDGLEVLLNESISDILEFADTVSTTWEENTVTIILHKYRFIDGCIFIQSLSPHCCTKFPCPVCSLCGTLITEGTSKIVRVERCSVSSPNDVTAVLSFSEPSPGDVLS